MYKTFKSEQDKMDGQQSSSPTSIRSNAGGAALNYDETFDKEMEWFTHAIDAIHSELKDDMRPPDVPHNIAFPNHAQLSEQQKDKVCKLYNTLCTTKTKAKSYNENRTKGNDVKKGDKSGRDGEEKLKKFVLILYDAMVEEVDKWPSIVPSPQDVSSSHTAYYDAIQKVYIKAKEVALSNWKRAVEMQKQLQIMKQEKNHIRSSEGMSAREQEMQNQDAELRKLEDFLKQSGNEPREVEQRNSEGMRALENENRNLVAKIRVLEERDYELKGATQRKREGGSSSATENQNHARKISKLEGLLRERENELQEVKLRLSALMGAKLQDGNVNIADLSDTNRPTKIAERFGQLYDDFWTDAFQIQTGHFQLSEEAAIARLLEMLKDAQLFCEKISQKHTNGVLCELLLHEKSSNQIQKPQIKDLNEVQRKQLHELRRQTANCTTENLINMYFGYTTKARTFTEHEINLCTQYLELSVELCWYMIIQNPPVHIQFEPSMRGKPFKTGEYKFYSRSGKTFDYIVWPPLRLTEGGDLLAKGVAEPMR